MHAQSIIYWACILYSVIYLSFLYFIYFTIELQYKLLD